MTERAMSQAGLNPFDGQGGMAHADREPRCPLCGGQDGRIFCRTRDFNWGLPGEFTYVACLRCGLVRLSPAPSEEEVPDLYPPFCGAALACGEDRDAGNSLPPFHLRADILEALKPPPASLFDIGCGDGLFLAFMRRRGWAVGGLEPAGDRVEYARRVLGLSGVRRASWPTDSVTKIQADVVSFIHVLEHVWDPVTALHQARRLMKPGALLVLETPNVNGWPLRLFGRHCVQMDAPRHLWLFTPATLRDCAKKAGYETVYSTTYGLATMDWTESLRYVLATAGLRSYGRKSLSRQNREEAGQAEHRTAAGIFLKGLHAVEKSLCRGLNRVSGWAGQGSNILMVARKA